MAVPQPPNPHTAPFCRDCLAPQPPQTCRCIRCGGPRIIAHDELHQLCIAHIDCDAFYAAVEKRDNPALRDKPVIVGGGKRGVVSTCCYIARIHGVRSAMPMFKALKACPDAVVIKPGMAKYGAVGRQIREAMSVLTPLVEPLSIDEAFLDLTGTARLHGDSPARILARFAAEVEAEIGISVSVGLSYCKFLAKIASDIDKPRGFAVIGQKEATAFLADKPVTTIWGVGAAFAARLEKDGITTIGQLQRMDQGDLLRRYGTMGTRLFHLARGQDSRLVVRQAGAKSVSNETTFNEDHSDRDTLIAVLRALCEKVSARLKEKDLAGRTVVLKLKDSRFRGRTRNRQLADPTQLADRIFRTALTLLEAELDGTSFRLLGVGVSDLDASSRADPDDLVDVAMTRRAQAERAVDQLRGKFGDRIVETGYTFRSHGRGSAKVGDHSADDDAPEWP